MCSECGEEHDPPCYYCGETCFGGCDDPDVCRSCWSMENIPHDFTMSNYEHDATVKDDCWDTNCRCRCHDEYYEDVGVRFEAGVRYSKDVDGIPYDRKGVFPFLKLPGEVRDRIYGYTFLPNGKQRQRQSAKHRGLIHTNLLRICRQVYQEAGTLPLTLNKISVSHPLHALDFFGFQLAPKLRHLVTGVHIEYHCMEIGNLSWEPLMRELARLHHTHLALTIKGGQIKERLLDHTCWINRFLVMTQLKTFDLTLASALILRKDKEKIVEMCRGHLIRGYVRPEEDNAPKTKRTASDDGDLQSTKPTKKARQVFPVSSIVFMSNPTPSSTLTRLQTKHQAKIIHSPKSTPLRFTSCEPEREAIEEAAKVATDSIRQSLLSQYAQIEGYAKTLDFDAAPAKFRLEKALKAAEAVDERNFELLVHDILLTLDETFERITTARQKIPYISGLNGVLEPVSHRVVETVPSQQSSDPSHTEDSSDILMEL